MIVPGVSRRRFSPYLCCVEIVMSKHELKSRNSAELDPTLPRSFFLYPVYLCV